MLQHLNNIIILGDETNVLLEQKIRENEANFKTIDSQKTNSQQEEYFIDHPELHNKNNNNMCNQKYLLLTKGKLNEKEFFSSSNKICYIDTNISNNSSSPKSNINLNTIHTNNNNNSNNIIYVLTTPNDSFNNLNIIKKKIDKNVSIFKANNSNDPEYINFDPNHCQYITFLSNLKKRNNSTQKRTNIKKFNNPLNEDFDEDQFSTTYNRFLEKEKKIKEKVLIMKKRIEEQENKKCSFKPVINEKSIELASKNKEDFYSRQKRLLEQKEKKNANMKKRLETKEKEQMKKKQPLLNKKNREKSVEDTIHKLYEWDIKRKEKIDKKRKSKEIKLQNANKSKPKNRYNSMKAVNRLYKADIAKRKEKKENLNKLHTPTFQPVLFETYKSKANTPKKHYKRIGTKKKKFYKRSYKTSHYNRVNTDYKNNKNNCDENRDTSMCQTIRKYLFSKIKRKPKHEKIVKFTVNDDKITENKNGVLSMSRSEKKTFFNDKIHENSSYY